MRKRVLIIEDDLDVREVIGLVLQTQNCEILQAGNGREALELLRNSTPPDLILTDIMMPIMNGWEFLEAKALDPALCRIPVLILSAGEQKPTPENSNVLAFFPKPVDIAGLIERIRDLSH